MSRLITGLPGAGKTVFTLQEFLAVQNRPKFATHINGFDYQKHNVTKLEHFQDWVNCPEGSLVFIDEAQQFCRTRGPRDPLPDFLAQMETHRHRAIDIWCTTQSPMFVDVHLRRLLKSHHHYYRPNDLRTVSLFKWNEVQNNPEDRFSRFKAQTSRVKLPDPDDDIYKQYTSTVLDTYTPKLPKKLFLIPVFACVFLACMWFGYNAIFGTKTQSDTAKTDDKSIFDKLPNVVPDLSAPADAIRGSDDKPLTIADFTPVIPTMPYTAPYYNEIAKPRTFPRFAGCMRSYHKAKQTEVCRCVTQQGTTLAVPLEQCAAVVDGDGMPFDPFREEQFAQQFASADNVPRDNLPNNPPQNPL